MKDQNPFKQKLYNHTMPVGDDLWNRIESQLPPAVDKKRFPFFWLLLIAGGLLTGAFILLLSNGNQNSKDNKTPEQVDSVPAPTEVAYTDNTQPYNSNDINQDLSTEDITTTFKSNARETRNQNTLYSKNTYSLNSSDNSEQIFSIQNLNLSLGTSTSQPSRKSFATDALPLTDIHLLSSEEESSLGITAIKPDPSCYKFTGEDVKSNLSFDVFGGPGFSPKSFENTGGETPIYIEARKATEHNQYAWAAGARVNLNLKQGFALRVGLMYEQVGDIFDYRDSSAFQTGFRVDSFWAANGTFLYADTTNILILGSLIKKIHNRYHHLDVPLLVSYELPMRRATLMVNAGPVINLTTSFRGQILDPMLVPKHITPGAGANKELKAYKTNVGLSIYLGAGALFPLNDDISILIEPRFLYRIKPVTLDTYPLKEHRHFAGLNLGLRYFLN